MSMTWKTLLLTVGASVLVACSAQGSGAPPASEDTGALDAILSGGLDERSQVPPSLRDTSWRLVTIDRGGTVEDVEALNSSLAFTVDGVSGKTCNSYGADVASVTSDEFTTDGFFTTQMRCGGPAGDVDVLVQELLHAGATWKRQDTTLTLSRGDVTLTFNLQA